MKAEEELRFLILGAQREGNRVLAARLSPMGVTPSQAEVVRCLADAHPMSLRALGQVLVCETGSPSRLIDTLVGRGIVERREDPSDRRHVLLELTDTGRELDRSIRMVEAELYEWISDRIGSSNLSAAIVLLRSLVKGSAADAAIRRRRALAVPGA